MFRRTNFQSIFNLLPLLYGKTPGKLFKLTQEITGEDKNQVTFHFTIKVHRKKDTLILNGQNRHYIKKQQMQ